MSYANSLDKFVVSNLYANTMQAPPLSIILFVLFCVGHCMVFVLQSCMTIWADNIIIQIQPGKKLRQIRDRKFGRTKQVGNHEAAPDPANRYMFLKQPAS